MPKIECKHYLADEGGKRCSSYIENGGCRHPEHLMCDEWLKVNPSASSLGIARDETRRGAERRAEREADLAPDDRLPTQQDVDSWKELGSVVKLSIGNNQSLYIVPDYTGKDRNEISVDHACALALICRAFPDARVEEFYRKEDWE